MKLILRKQRKPSLSVSKQTWTVSGIWRRLDAFLTSESGWPMISGLRVPCAVRIVPSVFLYLNVMMLDLRLLQKAFASFLLRDSSIDVGEQSEYVSLKPWVWAIFAARDWTVASFASAGRLALSSSVSSWSSAVSEIEILGRVALLTFPSKNAGPASRSTYIRLHVFI